MKIFNLFNAIISLFLIMTKYGQAELHSSINVRTKLEETLHLKEVSILLTKLEQIQDLDLPEGDKQLLTVQLQSHIQSLLTPKT